MLQSFQDEFDLSEIGAPRTPAAPGTMLSKTNSKGEISPEAQKIYRMGVGKLLHMMRWTRPEIMNAVREHSRYMSGALLLHLKAMYRVMGYCVSTPNRGWKIQPNESWDGNPGFKFQFEQEMKKTNGETKKTAVKVKKERFHSSINSCFALCLVAPTTNNV